MEIKLRRIGSIYIIDIIGEMDLYHAFKLKSVVQKMIAKNIHHYVINLEQVGYIDSSGIGALLYVHSELKKKRLLLKIAHVHGSVKKVIQLTKLMEYFPIVDNLSEAIKQLQTAN